MPIRNPVCEIGEVNMSARVSTVNGSLANVDAKVVIGRGAHDELVIAPVGYVSRFDRSLDLEDLKNQEGIPVLMGICRVLASRAQQIGRGG